MGYVATEYITTDYVADVENLSDSMFLYETLYHAWVVTANDSLEMTDTVSIVLGLLVSDWITLVDSQTNNWNGREIVPTEYLNLYDLSVGSKHYDDTISETIGITDTSLLKLTVTILDYLGFSELASAMKSCAESISESVSLVDSAERGFALAVESILAAVDAATVGSLFYNSITESLITTDAAGVINNIGISVTDPLTFTETVSSLGHFYSAVYDTLALSVTVELGGEVYECYVLNTPKFHPSMYSGFNFNSYCVFEGRAFGANDTGIYELTGDTDAGSTIHSGVVLSKTDFGSPNQKRFRKGYIGVSGTSPVMVFETESGKREVYSIDTQGKVTASSELKSKKWTLSIADFDTLDTVKLLPIILTK